MFNLANFLEEANVMKGYGVGGTEGLTLDFAHFKAQRDAYVKRLNVAYMGIVDKFAIHYVKGTASFVSDKVVQVADQTYTAEHVLIASGSQPETGGFPGSELCMDSDGFFEMQTLPKRAVVIGGGYIGVELAQILHALGVKVTLIVRSLILKFVDRDIINVLQDNMRQLGSDLKLNSVHESVVKNEDDSLTVNLKGGASIECDVCLVALGRPPNVAPLAL